MTPIPTVYEEHRKIIDSKDSKIIEGSLEALENQRIKEDLKAILTLVNDQSLSKVPLTNKLVIERATYEEAVKSLVFLQNPDVLEAMMLLYQYMHIKNTFKIDFITGTELLNLGGYKGIRQKDRHRILSLILENQKTRMSILDPEKSIKNYTNKSSESGLAYKFYDFIRIKGVEHSKKNPNLIVKLEGIEFLPEYIEHIHKISRRYLPIKSINKIPKESKNDRSKHFLYRLCFKFAGMKKDFCELTLEQCMNIGQFFNQERNMRRRWLPIEKSLLKAKKIRLIDYSWNFVEINQKKADKDNIDIDEFNNITNVLFDENGYLEHKYFKYIKSITIKRLYPLHSNEQLSLPIDIDQDKPKKYSKIEAIF